MSYKQEVVQRALDMLGSGTKPGELSVQNLSGLDGGIVAAISKMRTATEAGNDGRPTCRRTFYDNFAFFASQRERWNDIEEWQTLPNEHLILQTLKCQRDRSTAAKKNEGHAYLRDTVLTALNRAVNHVESNTFIMIANGDAGIDPDQLNNAPAGVNLIFMPTHYSEDVVKVGRVKWHWATDAWREDASNNQATIIEYENTPLAVVRTDGVIQLLASPTHTSAGIWTGSGHEQLAALIHLCVGEHATAAAEYSDEDVKVYDFTQAVIKMASQSVGSRDKELKRVADEVATLQSRNQEYSDLLAQNIQQLAEAQAAYAELEIPVDETSRQLKLTFDTVSGIENKEPVKSAEVVALREGAAIRVALHPLVVDCFEQEDFERWKKEGDEKSYIAGRGKPSYRYLPNLVFHIMLEAGGRNPSTAIKWVKPETKDLPKGQTDNRCHPHIQFVKEGRACWGDAAPYIADSYAKRDYDALTDWIFNWCANIRAGDPIIKTWQFAPADKDATLGWVIPEETATTKDERVLATA